MISNKGICSKGGHKEGTSNIRCSLGRVYGKVIEPFKFSWDTFDVSVGSCLVLYESGIRIDEEINLQWNNRSYPVWVREVEHPWPPELKEILSPVMVEEIGEDGNGMMDLEEGEIWPVVAPYMVALGIPATGHPEKQGVGKRWRQRVGIHCMGNQSRVQVGPSFNMGQPSCATSRKRPRLFRSPISMDFPNGQTMDDVGGKRIGIPSFPDLNSPAYLYPGSSDESISREMVQSDGNFGAGTSTAIPETQPVGNPVDINEEVADTIAVGNCVGIQV
ncbi:hypothetical protein L1987_57572 [Smallanthus sonchifolius]|uniref:Uncharacterized protein n=1 Tax=Smallanthus sonchifolius TaxID=185202 RepID=A0ACB9DDH4_9ASTR|nr:hypothetical protein L1987_57572 [Smallanthus sonchifolius]